MKLATALCELCRVVITRPKDWKSVEEVDIVRAYHRAVFRHHTGKVPRKHERVGKIKVSLKNVDCSRIGVGMQTLDEDHIEDTFVAMHMADCRRKRHSEL